MAASIVVHGLNDFDRALRAMNADFPKEMQRALQRAADTIAEGTRDSFLSRTGVSPKMADSVKTTTLYNTAQVVIGGSGYPYTFGAEFGGGAHGPGNPTPRGGHTTQFDQWRGKGEGAGYSLFETVRNKSDEVAETFGHAIDDLTRRAFPGRAA